MSRVVDTHHSLCKFLSAFSSHHSVCLIFHAALISLLSYTLLLLPQYFFSLSLIVNYRHDDFLQTFFRSIFKVINCLLTKSHSGDGSTTISGPTSFGVCGEPASCPSSGITEKRPRWRYGDPPGYYKKILSHEEDLRGCIKLPASTESVLQFAHPLVARLTLESDRPLNQIPFFEFNFLVSNFSQNHLKKREKKKLKI